MEKLPRWAERSMQGLVFWIGHRRALYSSYLLSEGAIVAEACNLINANLNDGEVLLCEELYTTLDSQGRFGKKCRADIVVKNSSDSSSRGKANVHCSRWIAVIEVKRGNAPRREIDKDLKRLAKAKMLAPQVRAFLILVSESKIPVRFVSEKGKAIVQQHQLKLEEGKSFYYRVRRACKATASFERKNSAHYACIIEVFTEV